MPLLVFFGNLSETLDSETFSDGQELRDVMPEHHLVAGQ
jgi:hypothetical protein